MWRVERNAGRGWRPNGIKESNYPYASKWWANLRLHPGVRYRLIKES